MSIVEYVYAGIIVLLIFTFSYLMFKGFDEN